MTTSDTTKPAAIPEGIPHWLFIRMDRIGDVVLTLPCDEAPAIRAAKSIQVTWVVAPAMAFILDASDPVRQYVVQTPRFSFSQFFKFTRWLRGQRVAGVIVFQAPSWVFFATWLARIPLRGGVLSRPVSFFALNRGVRQRRSEALKHESAYNLELLRPVGLTGGLTELPEPLRLRPPARVSEKNLDFKRYLVVHAGMAGSARNWNLENYRACIERLSQEWDIVMTGTHVDRPYLEPLKAALEKNPRVHWWNEKLSAAELLQILASAHAVIAPSTGVVHLAAALGVPTLGLYSPVKVQAALRWGPRGVQATVFEPQDVAPSLQCPGHFQCLMEKCPHFDCLNLITPSRVVEWVRSHEHQPK